MDRPALETEAEVTNAMIEAGYECFMRRFGDEWERTPLPELRDFMQRIYRAMARAK